MHSPNSNFTFSRVPRVDIPRSSFRRDRTYKTTFDAGYLIPFYSDEVYPGDTFNVFVQAFARLATPVLPFMDNLKMDFFFFFVPYRLLWTHWNNFLGEQDDPDDTTTYLTPILGQHVNSGYVDKLQSIEPCSLLDYFGFPVGSFNASSDHGLVINAFLPRAYNKVWNDHFRDENLQDRVIELKGDGPDYIESDITQERKDLGRVFYRLLKRGKRKDYFTSALPWPQKGPGVAISMAATGNAPVYGNGDPLALTNLPYGLGDTQFVGILSSPATTSGSTRPNTQFANWDAESGGETGPFNGNVKVNSPLAVPTKSDLADADKLYSSGLYAELNSSLFSPVAINDLRMAFQLQRLLEKNARGGTRVNELILQHFGVVCPDYRLQRSEFLGGGEIPVQIHQVTQTSSSDNTSPQGNTAAFGIASGRVGFSKSFVEHGLVLGLVSVRADLTYQQGVHRSWTRRARYDYYWPTLAHLGEQAILNKEIYATGDSVVDDAAFGYQERWAELRYGVSQITGMLRSGINNSLDIWHLAQYFSNLPTLNSTFIEDNPPVDRVIAVPSEPQFVFDSKIVCNCVRPLPMYSVPGLIDHF